MSQSVATLPMRSIIVACFALSFACGSEDAADGSAAAQTEPDATETAAAEPDAAEPDATEPDAMDPSETQVTELDTDLVAFEDPDSGFSTNDVYDANREIMNFDAMTNALIWKDGSTVTGFEIADVYLTSDSYFMVRFGSEGGERRAYFTETSAGTICDVVVTGTDQISIYATDEIPPQE